MKNNLIESAISFIENTNKNNGNLRSGVINEASFPEDHVKSGIEMHKQNLNNGALNSESKGMLAKHARTKLGYSSSQSESFANHVIDQHAVKRYTSGKRSDLDMENLHGNLKEESSFPEDHVKSAMKTFKAAAADGAMGSEAEGAVIRHATTKLGYSMDTAREFAKHIRNKSNQDDYTSGPRSSLDQENLHKALGGSGK